MSAVGTLYEIVALTADSTAFGEDHSNNPDGRNRFVAGGNSWWARTVVQPERNTALVWVTPTETLMVNHKALTELMGRNAQYTRADARMGGGKWYYLGEQMNETLMQDVRDNILYTPHNRIMKVVQQRRTEIFNWMLGLVGEVGIKSKEAGDEK